MLQCGTSLVLWDASYLWGLMAWRAINALGIPCGLVSAQEIAQGALIGKQCKLLIVPGGSARLKAAALGMRGKEAIREWLDQGGIYLGFCGGAGLALTNDFLGICPWKRRTCKDRASGLISGYLSAKADSRQILLPVWWPARFEPDDGVDKVHILATFAGTGSDLWLGDRKISNYQELPCGEPLIIRGAYGKGGYILSYAHLETPASTDANSLLASMLEEYLAFSISQVNIPQWHISPDQGYEGISRNIYELIQYGALLELMYPRLPWLWGWRNPMPGIILNHLLAMTCELDQLGEASDNNWYEKAKDQIADFAGKARPIMRSFAEFAGHAKHLERERSLIFGDPMRGGGMAGRILADLECKLHEIITKSS